MSVLLAMTTFMQLDNNARCTLTDQYATIKLYKIQSDANTAHLVLVTASVVYGLYKELAPEHEEECTPLPPSD